MIHYREGVEGTVVVSEPKEDTTGANRVLWINAVQATASIEKGVKMNRLQGVLPLLLHPGPREALFMCFGSGITAGTLAIAGFDRIDAVEISRDVLDAAPLFSKDNFGVVENPKVNLVVDDGRNFLLTTKKHYDVITFEPMPLALAGVSTFYTQEYYQLCLDHLAPGGIVSQWVPLHSLSADLVRSLLYTFTSVFPEYCIWFVNADLFITGSNAPLVVDYAVARERIAQEPLHAALEEVGLDEASELLACFFMGKDTVERYVQGGEVMSDDRPWAEFVAPKLMYERNVGAGAGRVAALLRRGDACTQLGGRRGGRAAGCGRGTPAATQGRMPSTSRAFTGITRAGRWPIPKSCSRGRLGSIPAMPMPAIT